MLVLQIHMWSWVGLRYVTVRRSTFDAPIILTETVVYWLLMLGLCHCIRQSVGILRGSAYLATQFSNNDHTPLATTSGSLVICRKRDRKSLLTTYHLLSQLYDHTLVIRCYFHVRPTLYVYTLLLARADEPLLHNGTHDIHYWSQHNV